MRADDSAVGSDAGVHRSSCETRTARSPCDSPPSGRCRRAKPANHYLRLPTRRLISTPSRSKTTPDGLILTSSSSPTRSPSRKSNGTGFPSTSTTALRRSGSGFPEIDYDKVDAIRGMNVVICTSANTDAEARALLGGFDLPFRE